MEDYLQRYGQGQRKKQNKTRYVELTRNYQGQEAVTTFKSKGIKEEIVFPRSSKSYRYRRMAICQRRQLLPEKQCQCRAGGSREERP